MSLCHLFLAVYSLEFECLFWNEVSNSSNFALLTLNVMFVVFTCRIVFDSPSPNRSTGSCVVAGGFSRTEKLCLVQQCCWSTLVGQVSVESGLVHLGTDACGSKAPVAMWGLSSLGSRKFCIEWESQFSMLLVPMLLVPVLTKLFKSSVVFWTQSFFVERCRAYVSFYLGIHQAD